MSLTLCSYLYALCPLHYWLHNQTQGEAKNAPGNGKQNQWNTKHRRGELTNSCGTQNKSRGALPNAGERKTYVGERLQASVDSKKRPGSIYPNRGHKKSPGEGSLLPRDYKNQGIQAILSCKWIYLYRFRVFSLKLIPVPFLIIFPEDITTKLTNGFVYLVQ